MKIKNIITLIIIAAIVALLVWIKINKDKVAASKIAVPATVGQAVLVTGYVVQPQSLDNKIQATGSILANEEVQLQSETAGKIVGLYLQEGSKVKKGDLLVKINDSDLQANLKKAESAVKLDEDNEFREKKLLDIKGISQGEYDGAINLLNGAKADVELVKAQIAKTEIKAPFDGVIGLKSVSEGSYISNATIVANLEELDPVKIDFSIPEKYMNQVHKGDEIIFNVAGSPQQFKGSIYAFEPRIDIASRTLQIRAKASNKDNTLLSGAFASIELVLQHLENVIMVPTQCIIPGLKNQKVFVSRNGHAQSQLVETGIRNDISIEVTKGLQTGDTIITTGMLQLRDGMPIRIISTENNK